MKRFYSTGKGRKELPKFMRKWYDRHYEDKDLFEENRKRDSLYFEVDKGYLKETIESLGKLLLDKGGYYSTGLLGGSR